MLKSYFKIAFRNISRNKVYSFINIFGLSIGLACAMLIILYVKDEVSYDRFLANSNTIYRVVAESVNEKDPSKNGSNPWTGLLQGPRFTANIPDLKSYVRIQSSRVDIRKATDVTSHEALRVDSSFFQIFSFPLLKGDRVNCLKSPRSLVLSQDEAIKQFGTVDAVGKIIMIKNDSVFEPWTVSAVAKRCPQNSSVKFEILLPFKSKPEDEQNSESWFSVFLNTFVTLPANADVKAVEAKIQRFYEADSKLAQQAMISKFGPQDWKTRYYLQPITDMHLSERWASGNGLSDASNPMYAYILSGIALFILLIACINFVNLTVARSVKRAREIGIRKVVGGDRAQLIRQFLGESFILCLIAFVLAVGIVQLVLPVFNELSNKALALSYLFDIKLIGGYLVLFIITSLLAGFYPAIVLSGYQPVQTLYSRFTLGTKNYLQKGLVVFQFSLASILIIVTLTIYSQFNYLVNFDLGYDDSNLITLNKWPIKRNETSFVKNEFLKDPNIVSVSFKNGGRWGTIAKVNGDSTMQFDYETIDNAYLPILKIPIVKGRNFSPDYPSDSTHSVLVNEAFVKQAGWKNPLGEIVNFFYNNNEKYSVVGIVKDHHSQALNEKIKPALYTMKPANDYSMIWIKIKPGTQTSSLKSIESTFKRVFPLSPYSYTFKDDANRKRLEAENKWKQILLFGAVLTILISCVGLFGLSVLSAEKRTKEIGIRKVLGASVGSIVGILSKDFLKLVAIALITAIPLAWFTGNKWLENYPYRISVGWSLFAIAGIAVVLIALVTVSFQALKAALANPIKSLRSE